MNPRALVLALLFAASVWSAPPSAADLLRAPDVNRASLSPDGKHVVFVDDDDRRLVIHEVETGTKRSLRADPADAPQSIVPAISTVRWVGPGRVLLGFNYSSLGASVRVGPSPATSAPVGSTLVLPSQVVSQLSVQLPRAFSGFLALDINGRRRADLPSLALRSDSVPPSVDVRFAWDARRIFVPPAADDFILVPAYDGPPNGRPHVVRIDTVKGTAGRLAANPGRVTEWIFERHGRSALGVDASGATVKLVAPDAAGKKWTELADLGEPRARLRFHLYDGARGVVYVSRPDAAGRWVFGGFRLKDAQWLPAIVANPRYDITPGEHRPAFAGIDLNDPLFSAKTGLPLAVNFVSDGPRQQWLDASLQAAMDAIAAADPKLTTLVIGVDREETRALTLSWSANQPGVYSLVDLATKQATRIAERAPWLRDAALAEVFPVRCAARDGVELDAYFAVPPGAQPKQLPLVVVLRELPWVRDTWGFHPLVQFLATRGYAVLQVNHRGSSGYGEPFLNAGREDPAGVIVDDVIAAVQWTIARGMVDPQRVAIAGTSFGGATALLALARQPELFRAGVLLTPITDWREVARQKDSPAYRFWFETMGLFPGQRSEQRLAQASPVTAAPRIAAPVLLVHAEPDTRASARATKALAEALRKAGRAPETFFHNVSRGDRAAYEKKEGEVYERAAAFLARHLPLARGGAAGEGGAR